MAALVVLSVGVTAGLVAWHPGVAWLACLVVIVAGVALSLPLTRWALRPARMFLAQQDQLIRSAVHEFHAPLTRLLAVAESAVEDGDEDPAESLRQVDRIARDASHTIRDLFDLALLVSGNERPKLEPVQLDRLVADALAERVGTVDTPASSIRTDMVPSPVEGDPALLRLAALNLVQNALRHGCWESKKPQILVTVRPDGVTVADDGPGMPEPKLKRLIEAANSGMYAEGMGLGLTIVGWVAELHRGRVAAVNRPEGGLSVGLELLAGDPVGM